MVDVRGKIEEELRRRVCPKCVLVARDGSCAAPFTCQLFASLDEVIEIISGVRDYSMEPYQERLRKLLCSHCVMDSRGHCARSEHLSCALDLYYPLIVEIIEKELYAE